MCHAGAILPCTAKRRYLLTLQVSRYCLLALHGSIIIAVYSDRVTLISVYPDTLYTLPGSVSVKHETLFHCCVRVGPMSQTMIKHEDRFGTACRVCWAQPIHDTLFPTNTSLPSQPMLVGPASATLAQR